MNFWSKAYGGIEKQLKPILKENKELNAANSELSATYKDLIDQAESH